MTGNDRKQLWLFTRELEEGSHTNIPLVSFLTKTRNLKHQRAIQLFVFFPTKENTNLKFIIQAPFLLTDNREGIKAGDSWNENLVNKLSVLAAESLPILKKDWN